MVQQLFIGFKVITHQQDDKLLALLVPALPAPSSTTSTTRFGLVPASAKHHVS